MVKEYEWRSEILQFLFPYMEECFQNTCRLVQTEIDTNAEKIWNELEVVLFEIMGKTAILQKQEEKGNVQYLAFSFMKSGTYLKRLEIRIDAFDEGFYLDEKEVEGYYCPEFLKNRYREDLEILYKAASKQFARLQNYELMEVQKKYTDFYDAIIFRMLQNLIEPIMDTVTESDVDITEKFMIIYGEYMDRATVLYKRGDSEG